jgi:LPS-assembly lipoprotein
MSSSERRALVVSTAGALLLAGCGFSLRQPPKLSFGSIALVGFAPHSGLAEELRRQLARQVSVTDTPARAAVVLQALDDTRDKSVVTSTSAAQVRALQLRLRFNFSAHTPGGRELIHRVELLVTRELSYNETAALAKEAEEGELYRDMIGDVVAQVLRRLAAVVV